jgi:hypothetical protein
MSFVWSLRQLWRLRLLVALGALVAILVGLSVAYRISLPATLHSRQYDVGIASTTALIDTSNSQVVDLGDGMTNTAGSLPGRAMLLARLLAAAPLKDEIARRAGVPPRMLIGIAGSPDASGGDGTDAATGTAVKLNDPRANILTVGTDEALPLLDVQAQAPSVATAQRLANAAVAVLISRVDSLAGADGIPSARRLVVKQLGTARGAEQLRGPSRMMAVIAGVFVFLLVCGGILLSASLSRAWWRAKAEEYDMETDDVPVEDAGPYDLEREEGFDVVLEPEPSRR